MIQNAQVSKPSNDRGRSKVKNWLDKNEASFLNPAHLAHLAIPKQREYNQTPAKI